MLAHELKEQIEALQEAQSDGGGSGGDDEGGGGREVDDAFDAGDAGTDGVGGPTDPFDHYKSAEFQAEIDKRTRQRLEEEEALRKARATQLKARAIKRQDEDEAARTEAERRAAQRKYEHLSHLEREEEHRKEILRQARRAAERHEQLPSGWRRW